jgi:hypothetical protein
MLIYTSTPKRKTPKPNAKQRQLQASRNTVKAKPLKSPAPYRRETPNYPSAGGTSGVGSLPEQKQYTGNAMMGIATLHKSNAVPVFSQEDAVEISRMRRG